MPYYDSGTQATGINISNACVWVTWNVNYTVTSSITTTTNASGAYTVTWSAWNGLLNASAVTAYGTAQAQNYRPAPETEEQKQLRATRYAEQVAAAKLAQEELDKARARAEKLLRENLSAAQLAELVADNHFTLRTLQPDGSQRIYRIKRGRSRNIQEINEAGAVLRRLCAHPVEDVPDADTMLAQKLWLEADEEAFRRIANFS